MGRYALEEIVRTFRNWDISKEEVWKILMENPLLWLNHPRDVFDLKRRMLRMFKFTIPMVQTLLREYPSALIW